MRILVVEDDERILSFLKRGLEAEEFTVDCVLSKPEALQALAATKYDGIILDVFLGPDSGLDICRTLRINENAIPVLVLSAMGSPDMKRRSFLAGADDFLSKPFAFDDLINKMHAAINMKADASAQSA